MMDSFVVYAMQHYDNPRCKTIEQFNSDLTGFSTLKKYLKDEAQSVEKIKITLNLITSLFNMFSNEGCVEMMYYKVRPEHHFRLKAYLVYLGRNKSYIEQLRLDTEKIKPCELTEKELSLI